MLQPKQHLLNTAKVVNDDHVKELLFKAQAFNPKKLYPENEPVKAESLQFPLCI